MGTPFLHELKKQASFFLREKIKTVRLALTDVTPAELLTEEVTNGNPRAPDMRVLKIISRAAFEIDDFWRIMEILHKRLARFDRNNWRLSYNALIVLENLLTHGPESVSEEFQGEKDVITEMGSFQHIDEKGFNWGFNVRKKSERVLKLLEKGPLLKEERDRARKLTRGIKGFGSLCQRTTSAQGILQETSLGTFGRCNSTFTDCGNVENEFLCSTNESKSTHTCPERSRETPEENVKFASGKKMENPNSRNCSSSGMMLEDSPAGMSFKENMAPEEEIRPLDLDEWKWKGELKPLLGGQTDEKRVGVFGEEDHHPFNELGYQATVSLLSSNDQLLQAC